MNPVDPILLHRGRIDDTVVVDKLPGSGLHGDDAAAKFIGNGGHLGHRAGGVGDDVVGENHDERFVADGVFGGQDGVAEAEGLFLNHEGNVSQGGGVLHLSQQVRGSGGGEASFQVGVGLEVRGDGLLAGRGDDYDLLDTGLYGLLDDVLEHWLVQDGQQLFGEGLGHRKEAGAKSGCRYDGFPNLHSGLSGIGGPVISVGSR